MVKFDLDHLLSAIQVGDTRAFGSWMSGVESELRMSLRSFARSVDTEAVLQETLIRVWQVAPRFVADGKPNGLLRLALTIARNLAISETRRLKTTAVPAEKLEVLLERNSSLVDEPEPEPLLPQALAECREKLPPKPSQVFEQRLNFGGKKADDVLAEELGMRVNTFLQNFTRARKMLVECLRSRGFAMEKFE